MLAGKPFGQAMDRLLKQKSVVRVDRHGEVAGNSEQLGQVAALLDEWSQELGSKSDLFDLERHMLIQVAEAETDGESDGNQLRSLRAAAISAEPTVRLSAELVEAMAEQQFWR